MECARFAHPTPTRRRRTTYADVRWRRGVVVTMQRMAAKGWTVSFGGVAP